MTTPTIDLPGPIFAKLAPHPYQLRALSRGARTNGRATQEPRALSINASPLSHAHGSALVRLGDTTVLCGVRGELLPVEQIPQFRPLGGEEEYLEGEYGGAGGIGRGELRDYDLLVPNIELATGSAPQFLPGVPPTALAQTLSTRVYSLLHAAGLVKAGDLRVWYRPGEGKKQEDGGMEGVEQEVAEEDRVVAYWVLYIDLLFLSYDGNPFDAAWAAVVAALRDTKLPVTRWDPDREMVVCSRAEERKLNIKGLPVACSAAVFMEKEQSEAVTVAGDGRNWILLDPDRLEETLCKEMITIVVDCSDGETRIKSLEKQGGTVLGRELIRGFVGVAEERWAEVQMAMK
ncbi:ribosomal protein S5 domain 2-type protein [Staphylotrichum tortipilum]|uniref:Ribosomal RNA-processing protein 43 n=1 Tax=Staphylotrichum tortipilum TaxID=2831512 RepID=A0AAN6MJ43_9PEZI|nr:ribosomal protein S5 domain 2-type protein [Staphylotrichum longicolle]